MINDTTGGVAISAGRALCFLSQSLSIPIWNANSLPRKAQMRISLYFMMLLRGNLPGEHC